MTFIKDNALDIKYIFVTHGHVDHIFGIPDIFVEDNQTFKLGLLEIKTIHTSGHSPGGICYFKGNILFSGDVLLYRSVGRTDTQNG
jgi:hydroxyacylglutathione hydrolase